jgi:ComF family protein
MSAGAQSCQASLESTESPRRCFGVMPRRPASRLLSLVVPPLCSVCREPEIGGHALCDECRARLVALRDPRCSRCGAPLPHRESRCRECRGRALAFVHAWSAFAYEGIAREVVSALKARGLLVLAAFMAREVSTRAPAGLLSGTLVPVPAHALRRRRHGFNQARAIARPLGRAASLPVGDVLRRVHAPAQVGLERRARLSNARGSVRLRAGASPPPRAVLVDDVYTTGASLDACARALLESGTHEVVAVTFARALRGY